MTRLCLAPSLLSKIDLIDTNGDKGNEKITYDNRK